MDVGRTAFGTWSGGRFMNFGEALTEERWIRLVRLAYERGIRTFITADVYGAGAADALLGRALDGLPRASYGLVGAVGHDFYKGRRQGASGYPRFTDPALRPPSDYHGYLRMAVENPSNAAAPRNSICSSSIIPIPPATAATASGPPWTKSRRKNSPTASASPPARPTVLRWTFFFAWNASGRSLIGP
jgi:hypothetical protein